MVEQLNNLSVLSEMITPAVLISACGTLIFSTSTRLARIVDRVRGMIRTIEQISAEGPDYSNEHLAEVERQIRIHTRRSRYIQRSLTCFYISLGLFVGTTVSIGLTTLIRRLMWLPEVLGIAGTLVLFYGSMMLIAETRLALRSVNSEMEFTLMLYSKYRERRAVPEISLKREYETNEK